jgi:hypothetical protein
MFHLHYFCLLPQYTRLTLARTTEGSKAEVMVIHLLFMVDSWSWWSNRHMYQVD